MEIGWKVVYRSNKWQGPNLALLPNGSTVGFSTFCLHSSRSKCLSTSLIIFTVLPDTLVHCSAKNPGVSVLFESVWCYWCRCWHLPTLLCSDQEYVRSALLALCSTTMFTADTIFQLLFQISASDYQTTRGHPTICCRRTKEQLQEPNLTAIL